MKGAQGAPGHNSCSRQLSHLVMKLQLKFCTKKS